MMRRLSPGVIALALTGLLMSVPTARAANCADAVTRLLLKHWDVKKAQIVPKADLKRDLGADALDQIEMIMAMEEEFGFAVPEADESKFVTVSDLVAYADRNAKKGCK
jgi:acyl carrier protein